MIHSVYYWIFLHYCLLKITNRSLKQLEYSWDASHSRNTHWTEIELTIYSNLKGYLEHLSHVRFHDEEQERSLCPWLTQWNWLTCRLPTSIRTVGRKNCSSSGSSCTSRSRNSLHAKQQNRAGVTTENAVKKTMLLFVPTVSLLLCNMIWDRKKALKK